MFMRRTCQEAALLITSMRDRKLGWRDRIALRFHMLICKACPRFQRQARLMDQAMGSWRSYVERD